MIHKDRETSTVYGMPCHGPKTTVEKDWPYDEYYRGERDQDQRKHGHGENHWSGAEVRCDILWNKQMSQVYASDSNEDSHEVDLPMIKQDNLRIEVFNDEVILQG